MVREITISEMEEILAQGADLVDVREADELVGGTIEGYRHMPLSTLAGELQAISQSRPTIFYCRSGKRSLKAAGMAEGITKQPLYSLRGGYLEFASIKGR